MSNTSDPTTQTTTTATTTENGTGTNAGTQTPTIPDPTTTERTFSQAQLDDIVKDRLNRQRAQLQQEREQEAMKAQAKWEPLAQQHEARVKELEPQVTTLTDRIQGYEDILIRSVEAEIKDWPAEAKALIPAEADALAQMAAVEKARPLIAKITGATAQGNGPGPRPRAGQQNNEQSVETLLRNTGRYNAI